MSGQGKEKKVSDKDVILDNQKRDVWLVKVPKYVADRWESSLNGSDVGKIKIKPKAGGGMDVEFNLSDELAKERKSSDQKSSNFHVWSTTDQKIPSEYKLDFLKPNLMATQHLAVLSQTTIPDLATNESGEPTVSKRLAVEGRVSCRAECKIKHMAGSDLYMKVKREALLKPAQTARKVQKINKLVKTYKPVANHANNIAHEKRMKMEGKKSRDDKERVQELLFALFEKHQYYNIKDLVRETRQPITYLKTILNEVCRYNVKNPHKNMWELKPEYRHYKGDDKEEKPKENGESSDDDDGF